MRESESGAVDRPQEFLVEWSGGLGLSALDLVLLGVVCCTVGLGAATQVFADGLRYHENLGPGLFGPEPIRPIEAAAGIVGALIGAGIGFRRGQGAAAVVLPGGLILFCVVAARGPLYLPTEFIRWVLDYHAVPEIRPFLERGWTAFGIGIVGAGVSASVVLSGAGKRRASNSHGSAHWGTGDELAIRSDEAEAMREAKRHGEPAMLRSLVIGRHRNGGLLLFRGEGHLITAAATRTGKGVGCVIPNLLLYEGSIVNTDIKGENFFVTHRKRVAMGQEVFVLDPFRETARMAGGAGRSLPYLAACNPLGLIRTDEDDAIDVARMIAGMVIPDEEGPNKHFSDEGRGFYAAVILHVCYIYAHEPARRTLLETRRIITVPDAQFRQLLAEMASSDYRPVATAAAELLQKEAREFSGTLSTIYRNTRFLDSPGMERVLGHDPRRMFHLETLKGAPVTVYLVLPPDRLNDYAAWIRVMLGCCNSAMARSDVPPPRVPVLALVDEAGQLGQMEPLERTITLLTGYGIRVWFIFQDFPQMKKHYPKSFDTIFGACSVRVMFGTGDMTTADLASKYAGETTIFSEGGSRGSSRSTRRGGGFTRNAGDSVSEKGRKLLLPDEVLRLGEEQQLVFVRGTNPLLVDKIRHWRDRDFDGDHDPNPLHRSAA